MNKYNKKLGIALSGGGIRAAIFHLGVLTYLAEVGLFKKITSISSVSGASLCIGVIFAVNYNIWPCEENFIKFILPKIKDLILTRDIQKTALRRLIVSPQFWHHRVKLLAKVLESEWGIKGSLQDLPQFPFWEINCTTFETGSRFRFRRDYMGDSHIGYVQNPEISISDMIAASAAFPVLIGPYLLKTDGLTFTRDKHGKKSTVKVEKNYSLWDGGVYDNLGLEALHKIGSDMDDEINYILVSNASASLGWKQRGRPSTNMRRLLNIAMSQSDTLRTRDFISAVVREKKGDYIKIGQLAGEYKTTLHSPSEADFDLIFNDGYTNAKQTIVL